MSFSGRAKVFVYGTLKKGEPNHYWLSDTKNGFSKFISPGKTVKKYPLVIATRYNIPFLLDKKGTGNRVDGEIYEVDEPMLQKLDELEQYPEFYDREVQDIQIGDGTRVPCWLYLVRNYPKLLLSKELLTSYRNTDEYPYYESDSEPSVEQMVKDMAVDYRRTVCDDSKF